MRPPAPSANVPARATAFVVVWWWLACGTFPPQRCASPLACLRLADPSGELALRGGAEMATVTVAAEFDPLSEPEALAGLSTSLQAAAAERKMKVRCEIFTRDLQTVWSDEVKGTPGMMKKIVVSKARSFFDGKELQDPGGCKTMCCFLCPWCWGCTKQMAVLGTVGIEVPGTAAACIVVSGAPAGSDDLAICKEALAAAGFAQNDAGVYTLTLSTAG
jgi:hypothetical protein